MSESAARIAPRIVLSGGGTAGHVAPALAVASELKAIAPETELLYIGTAAGLEADLVRRAGIPFASVKVTPISGRSFLQAVKSLGRAATATSLSADIIRGFRPDAALGTGGYVAGPVLAAALLLGVPAAIHEQNLRPGITNRLLSRMVRQIYVSFELSRAYFPAPGKIVFTGYPVRPEILASARAEGAAAFGLNPSRPTLLVVGGSRGALTINEAVKSGLPLLRARMPHLQVIVSTGQAYYDDVRESLKGQGIDVGDALHHPIVEAPFRVAGTACDCGILVLPYIHAMHHAYAAADLVLCRAGGSTHELTARGLPAIVVPSPNVAYDQQTDNARILGDAGAARVVTDAELDGPRLAELVVEMLTKPGLLQAMAGRARAIGRPQAGREIAQLLLQLAGFPTPTG